VQKRLEFTIDWINDSNCCAASSATGFSRFVPSTSVPGNSRPTMSCCSEGHSATETETWAWDSSPCARDVAWQIATDRRQQLYEAASLIPVLYDVRPPEPDEQQNLATAVHRRTAVTRQLATFKKPVSSTAQERLNSYILSLQQLSASSDAVVRLFEVFEDYMYVHLLLEQCTGGTVYEKFWSVNISLNRRPCYLSGTCFKP